MKVVKIQYVVRPEFANENLRHIQALLDDMRSSPIDGLIHQAYVLEDGKSFTHINLARDAESYAKLTELPAFKTFITALKGSNPIEGPAPTPMRLIDQHFVI